MNFQIGQVKVSVWSVTFNGNNPEVNIRIDAPIFGKMLKMDFRTTKGVENPIELTIAIWEESHAEESIK